MKQREDRRKTCLAAEMRLDGGWIGVKVLNISTRGMLVQSPATTARGDYVEITRGSYRVIGRIAWSRGGKCGLRAQDRIDIDAFTNADGGKSGTDCAEDSTAVLDRPAATPEQRLAQSQRLATIMQFGVLAVGGVTAAALLADSVHDLLSASFGQVAEALSGRG